MPLRALRILPWLPFVCVVPVALADTSSPAPTPISPPEACRPQHRAIVRAVRAFCARSDGSERADRGCREIREALRQCDRKLKLVRDRRTATLSLPLGNWEMELARGGDGWRVSFFGLFDYPDCDGDRWFDPRPQR